MDKENTWKSEEQWNADAIFIEWRDDESYFEKGRLSLPGQRDIVV